MEGMDCAPTPLRLVFRDVVVFWADTMTKPIHEIELTTAHSVRLIRPCEHCKGTGMRDDMIQAGMSGQPYDSTYTAAGMAIKYFFHPQCYIAKFGFRRATKLPASERGRFRMKDVTVRQMQRLAELAKDAQS